MKQLPGRHLGRIFQILVLIFEGQKANKCRNVPTLSKLSGYTSRAVVRAIQRARSEELGLALKYVGSRRGSGGYRIDDWGVLSAAGVRTQVELIGKPKAKVAKKA